MAAWGWSRPTLVEVRVVLIGDSHLTETSPSYQTVKLPPRLRRAGLDVTVAATGGANSRDVQRQPVPADPNWVIFSVGVNDAAPWKRIEIEEFEVNCDRILGATVAARWLLLGPGPVKEQSTAGGRTEADVAAYAAALERATMKHSARFVSMTTVVDHADLTDDGVHLNDSGYRKLADRVLAELGCRPS